MTRLRVEDLEVSTFATTVYGNEPVIVGTDEINPDMWTGCVSGCTDCPTDSDVAMLPQIQF